MDDHSSPPVNKEIEEPVKHQSSVPVNKEKSSSKLRYPLRSANKFKPPIPENTSANKSGLSVSSVTKSVSVLNISGKDKSVKPTRRLSTPSKPPVSPLPKPLGITTPVSEAKATRFGSNNNTPNTDVSRSSSRRKFSVLSSASYWLTQIKLSESAAKHSISLGLFKLALEAKCEPFEKVRSELKVYARRHNLVGLGEPAKQLFESYNISENFEPQVSETVSQVFEDGSRSSDEDVQSSSSVTGARKLKPKSLDTNGAKASPTVAKLGIKNATWMDNSGPKPKGSANRKSINTGKFASENVGHSISKKSKKPAKKESDINKSKAPKQGENADEKGPADMPVAGPLQENKENMDSPQTEEANLVEA